MMVYNILMAKAIEIMLEPCDKALMENLLASGQIKHKYAVRVQAVLNRAAGKPANAIADILCISAGSVTQYIKRYNAGGIDALLKDKTRKPGKAPVAEELKNKICDAACHEKPAGASRWTARSLAKRFGISHNKVAEILRERNIKPHVQSYYSFSNDPDFEKKLRDVVGLYLNPPDNAIVLCVDEKTQIQALERRQRTLFPQQNLPRQQSHDYYRHGTTTLFSALDMLTGNVIGVCEKRHRTEEYLRFIKKIDRECEKGKTLHIIADNYKTHSAAAIKEYAEKHPGRFEFHFTPAHSSWANLVERWFGALAAERLNGESWSSVDELAAAIKEYIQTWNKSKRVFQWSKSADTVIQNIEKRRSTCSCV
jgi:transposase